MMDWKTIAPLALQTTGKFQWPGRELLPQRERLLLEARSMRDLVISGTADLDGDLESVLGYLEYLIDDWRWLHDPARRVFHPTNYSHHKWLLRNSPDYRAKIKWSGPIPSSDLVLDGWSSWCN